jgi:deoxyadenosine/deoxycytidine kinase
MTKLVAITGTIGAGATTLSNRLVQIMGWKPLLEADVETNNPFFALYNQRPKEYAFHNQVTFLTKSAEEHRRLYAEGMSEQIYVQDFTPFEHVGVYSNVQKEVGNLTNEEFNILDRLSSVLSTIYITPRVLVYRQTPDGDLLRRIQERARPSELILPQAFLEKVNQRFEAWVHEWEYSPVVIVGPNIDVRSDDEAVREIGNEILTKL